MKNIPWLIRQKEQFFPFPVILLRGRGEIIKKIQFSSFIFQEDQVTKQKLC